MASPRPKPSLSVIVISFNAAALLERCLTALVEQARAVDAEVLIVRAGALDSRLAELRRRFGGWRWLAAPAGETIPRLRRLGLTAAEADVVALLEDDCTADAGWCAAVLDAHRGPWIAAGGTVEPGPYTRARDWAVYFYEYGRFMLPFEPHPSALLPGNNVSYKREAVLAANGDGDGFYDVFVHERWRRAGAPMQRTPSLVVRHRNSWSLSHVAVAPFHHGRGFAAKRVAGQPRWRRALFAGLSPLLPALQVFRIVRDTLGRRRLRGRLFVALPWIVLFATIWAAGECFGYLLGPGRSLGRWR